MPQAAANSSPRAQRPELAELKLRHSGELIAALDAAATPQERIAVQHNIFRYVFISHASRRDEQQTVISELERRLPQLVSDYCAGAAQGADCHGLRMIFQRGSPHCRAAVGGLMRADLGVAEHCSRAVHTLMAFHVIMGGKSGALPLLAEAVREGPADARRAVFRALGAALGKVELVDDGLRSFLPGILALAAADLRNEEGKSTALGLVNTILTRGAPEDRLMAFQQLSAPYADPELGKIMGLVWLRESVEREPSKDLVHAVSSVISAQRAQVERGLESLGFAPIVALTLGVLVELAIRHELWDDVSQLIEPLRARLEAVGLPPSEFLECAGTSFRGTWWHEKLPRLEFGRMVANHFWHIAAVELECPGGARALYDNFHIRMFGRYPPMVLQAQLARFRAPARDETHIGAYYAIYDHNGAFFQCEEVLRELAHASQRAGFPLVVAEADDTADFLKRSGAVCAHLGPTPISIIGGHSCGTKVWFGPDACLSVEDLSNPDLVAALRARFRQGGTVIHDSCSVGRSDDSFAAVEAQMLPGHDLTVWGPNRPSALRAVRLNLSSPEVTAHPEYDKPEDAASFRTPH